MGHYWPFSIQTCHQQSAFHQQKVRIWLSILKHQTSAMQAMTSWRCHIACCVHLCYIHLHPVFVATKSSDPMEISPNITRSSPCLEKDREYSWPCEACKIYSSMNWFREKSTGKLHISWKIQCFPADFPLKRPLNRSTLLGFSTLKLLMIPSPEQIPPRDTTRNVVEYRCDPQDWLATVCGWISQAAREPRLLEKAPPATHIPRAPSIPKVFQAVSSHAESSPGCCWLNLIELNTFH